MRTSFVYLGLIVLLLSGCSDERSAISMPAVLFDPPTECTISTADETAVDVCIAKARDDHDSENSGSGTLSGGELIQHCQACCFGNPDEDVCTGACVNAGGNLPAIGCEVPMTSPPPFDEGAARAECVAENQVISSVSPNCGSCDVVAAQMTCTSPDGTLAVNDRCNLSFEYESMGWSCTACERELATYRQCACPDGSASWQTACNGPRNAFDLAVD